MVAPRYLPFFPPQDRMRTLTAIRLRNLDPKSHLIGFQAEFPIPNWTPIADRVEQHVRRIPCR